ncbi:MAG: hypothetical protein V4627_17845 [Pseudomonadota bacterium]
MQHPALTTPAQPLQPRWRMGLLACALLGLAACQSAATTSPAEVTTEATLQQQLNTAIGQAPCTADTQCRTIGVGAKACGGPVAWRPWSTQGSTKAEALQGLADQLATLQRQRQAQSGMVSTCSYLPDPGAVCQAQRCVLKKTAADAS